MTESDDRPLAVRATAVIRPSRWRHRPVRWCRYDAYWADGRIEFDVSLSRVMYRRDPADFSAFEHAVHAACPPVGTGEWVSARASVSDIPDIPDIPAAPTDVPLKNARRVAYQEGGSDASTNRRTTLPLARLIAGAAGVALGAILLLISPQSGVPGFLGAVSFLAGVALIGSAIAAHRAGR